MKEAGIKGSFPARYVAPQADGGYRAACLIGLTVPHTCECGSATLGGDCYPGMLTH